MATTSNDTFMDAVRRMGKEAFVSQLQETPMTATDFRRQYLGKFYPMQKDDSVVGYKSRVSNPKEFNFLKNYSGSWKELNREFSMSLDNLDHAVDTNYGISINRTKKPREVNLMKHETVLKFWLETTRQVLTNIPNKIAGGYPRDLAFGVEPKDVDFFVKYNEKVVEEILDRLEQLKLPHHDCADDISDSKKYPTKDGEEEGRVSRVIKVGDFVDIIFVNHPLSKVTDNFDFNINQYELGMLDEPTYKGKPHNNVLQFACKDNLYKEEEEIKEGRTTHIVRKADRLGWVCSQEVLDKLSELEEVNGEFDIV